MGRLKRGDLNANALKAFRAVQLSKNWIQLLKAMIFGWKKKTVIARLTNTNKKKCSTQGMPSEANLHDIFCLFDRDCDGVISHNDLIWTMSMIDCPLNERDAQEMMDTADQNTDGKVDFNDFKEAIYKIVAMCNVSS